jgi:hypothetical protein
MNLLFLLLLFVLCILLPHLFTCLEGMEYSTEALDREEKRTTSPDLLLTATNDPSLNKI